MYRIRFHGRGGQGLKTASRILGTAFFLEGYEVQDAPRYGAERRGAPIFAFVRADKKPINERGVITNPDLVLVADDSLVAVPAAGVLQGLSKESVLVIMSHDTADVWQHRLNTPAHIIILPVAKTGEAVGESATIGTACAGAAAGLLEMLSIETLGQAIRDELSAHSESEIQKSLQIAIQAFQSVAAHHGKVQEGKNISASEYTNPDWQDVSFEEVQKASPTIFAAANSVEVRTGLWRTMRPVIDYDLCNRCWWVCSSFCPDSAIKVDENNYPHIDYDHCKGCLVCVAQCPPHAITAITEIEAVKKEKQGAAS